VAHAAGAQYKDLHNKVGKEKTEVRIQNTEARSRQKTRRQQQAFCLLASDFFIIKLEKEKTELDVSSRPSV
jgi:hypothetical protein